MAIMGCPGGKINMAAVSAQRPMALAPWTWTVLNTSLWAQVHTQRRLRRP